MNDRLERIDRLIKQGYKLEKTKILNNWEIALPKLTNSEGRQVNTLFGGPAGFSWMAFLLSPIFYFQIKEYSFYLIVGFAWFCIGNIKGGLQDAGLWDINAIRSSLVLIPIFLQILYASYFPYLRYIQRRKESKDNNLFLSIILGIFLYNLAKQIPLYFTIGQTTTFFKLLSDVFQIN